MPKKIKRRTHMRYIKVPEAVVLENIPGGTTTLTFSELIRKVLSGDSRVTQDDLSVTRFMELSTAVKSMKPGDVWELQEEVHEFLSLLARTFPNYHPEAKVSMLPLIKAITSASATKPVDPKPADAASAVVEKPAEA